jgi:hypothetical protein
MQRLAQPANDHVDLSTSTEMPAPPNRNRKRELTGVSPRTGTLGRRQVYRYELILWVQRIVEILSGAVYRYRTRFLRGRRG